MCVREREKLGIFLYSNTIYRQRGIEKLISDSYMTYTERAFFIVISYIDRGIEKLISYSYIDIFVAILAQSKDISKSLAPFGKDIAKSLARLRRLNPLRLTA